MSLSPHLLLAVAMIIPLAQLNSTQYSETHSAARKRFRSDTRVSCRTRGRYSGGIWKARFLGLESSPKRNLHSRRAMRVSKAFLGRTTRTSSGTPQSALDTACWVNTPSWEHIATFNMLITYFACSFTKSVSWQWREGAWSTPFPQVPTTPSLPLEHTVPDLGLILVCFFKAVFVTLRGIPFTVVENSMVDSTSGAPALWSDPSKQSPADQDRGTEEVLLDSPEVKRMCQLPCQQFVFLGPLYLAFRQRAGLKLHPYSTALRIVLGLASCTRSSPHPPSRMEPVLRLRSQYLMNPKTSDKKSDIIAVPPSDLLKATLNSPFNQYLFCTSLLWWIFSSCNPRMHRAFRCSLIWSVSSSIVSNNCWISFRSLLNLSLSVMTSAHAWPSTNRHFFHNFHIVTQVGEPSTDSPCPILIIPGTSSSSS